MLDGMSQLMTVREVAATLRVTTRTVRRRIATGDLDAVKLGPEQHAPVRVEEHALRRFMQPAFQDDERRQ